ncbi:MAG: hypothetical protein RLZZ356_1738, partial [Verrucomicrobiota bacterium]
MKTLKTEPAMELPVPDMSWDNPRIRVAMVEDSTGFGEMLAACLGHQPE